MTDYIDWAVDQKFGVMDINIPAYVTHDEVFTHFYRLPELYFSHDKQDSDAHIPNFKEQALTEQIQTLVCYLWDNHMQLYEADDIFIMGVGNAYLGVKVLLIQRGKVITGLVMATV